MRRKKRVRKRVVKRRIELFVGAASRLDVDRQLWIGRFSMRLLDLAEYYEIVQLVVHFTTL
jgi:hypothetical protein